MLKKHNLGILLTIIALLIWPGIAVAESDYTPDEAGLSLSYAMDSDIGSGVLRMAGVHGVAGWRLWERNTMWLDLRLEANLGTYYDYAHGLEASLSPVLRFSGTPCSCGGVILFSEVALGVNLNDLDIPELGTTFNFLSWIGAGMRFPVWENTGLELGCRMRHLSNGGITDRNAGVTSSQVLIGLYWAW